MLKLFDLAGIGTDHGRTILLQHHIQKLVDLLFDSFGLALQQCLALLRRRFEIAPDIPH
ncbi:MAG: hypothetical protein ACK40C_08265 [Novosphingobium meiothermophilum]